MPVLVMVFFRIQENPDLLNIRLVKLQIILASFCFRFLKGARQRHVVLVYS